MGLTDTVRMHNSVRMPPTVDLMTTAEVAERLGVSVSTVTRMAQSGRLTPAHKSPAKRGAYVFDRATVEAYVAERGWRVA